MLSLQRLRILCEIAEHGSIGQAAIELSYSHAAVSAQLAALEREIGESLAIRTNRGVRLTPAGEVLVEQADEIFAVVRQTEVRLATIRDGDAAGLRLAAFGSAVQTIVAAAISSFRDEHPEARVALLEAEPDEALAALRRGDVDLAVVYDFPWTAEEPDHSLELVPLLEDPLPYLIPERHPLARADSFELADLAGEPMIVPPEGSSGWIAFEASSRRAGFEPVVAMRTNDVESMKQLVARGLGIATGVGLSLGHLPPGVVARSPESGDAVRRVRAASLRSTPAGNGHRDALVAALVKASDTGS